ncbi:MAG: hypothetical protein AAF417_13285 [Pseudomonadota bacterium]
MKNWAYFPGAPQPDSDQLLDSVPGAWPLRAGSDLRLRNGTGALGHALRIRVDNS